MYQKKIPAPIIAVLADNLPELETHASLDNLFLYAVINEYWEKAQRENSYYGLTTKVIEKGATIKT